MNHHNGIAIRMDDRYHGYKTKFLEETRTNMGDVMMKLCEAAIKKRHDVVDEIMVFMNTSCGN